MFPQRAHLSHVVDIHIIYSYLVPHELLYPGPTVRVPEYQCLRYINHIMSIHWHHIHLLTSPFFYINAHYSSLCVIVQILYFTVSLVYFFVVLLVQCPKANSLQTAAAPPATGRFCRGGNRQSEDFFLALIV